MSSGKRLLLDRGSSWHLESTPVYGRGEESLISAYGDCLSPDEYGICANAPIISISGADSYFFGNMNDQRVVGLSFLNTSKEGHVLSSTINSKNILALRLKTEGFRYPFNLNHWRNNETDLNEKNFIVSCRANNSDLHIAYIGGERIGVVGNEFSNSSISHVVRIWQSYLGVFSHNIVSGASIGQLMGSHALKFHGSIDEEIGDYATSGGGGLAQRTKLSVISNNIFGGSGPWPVGVGPQNAQRAEKVSDVIIDSNKFINDYGVASKEVQVSLSVWGRYYSIRNNLFDISNTYDGSTGVVIGRRGVEWTPLGHRVYNNTFYRVDKISDANTQTAVIVYDDAQDIKIKNNLVSFVADNRHEVAVRDDSGTAELSANLLYDEPFLLEPGNSNPIMRDYSLTGNSIEAIGTGVLVPVYMDILGNIRNNFDIGAYDYGSAEPTMDIRADVNQDSRIGTQDALLILRKSLNMSMTETEWHNSSTSGDVDCDGVISTSDASLVLRSSLDLDMRETGWCE